MIETAITSSVLIAIIIGIRFLFSGKISRRLQYALWGLVLLRLCLPFALFSSSISIMNAFSVKNEASKPDTHYSDTSIIPSASVNASVAGTQGNYDSVNIKNDVTAQKNVTAEEILTIVWIGGSIAVGLWFAVANIKFYSGVIKTRKEYTADRKLPVYVAEGTASPCLFGMLRPSIYLTEKAVKNEASTRYALEHELCHYRHGDHIWSILRVLCLIAYWWNPLVWAAAVISRSDSEMACDEAVISRIGKDNRLSYGYVLVDMIAERNVPTALCCTATTMVSGKRSIKARLNMIVKNPKTLLPSLVTVLLIVAVCAMSTFTGAKAASSNASEALEKLAASVMNSGGQISFTIPESYKNPKDWNLHIAGRLVSEDGFSQSVHLMDDTNDQRAWEAGKTYSIPMDSHYTDLILTAYLPDKNGETLEKSIDLLKPADENTIKAYAQTFIQNNIKTYESYGAKITDSKIKSLQRTARYENVTEYPVELWLLEYRLKPEDMSKVIFAGGMTEEDGWITEYSSQGQSCLIVSYENGKPAYLGSLWTLSFAEEGGQEEAIRLRLQKSVFLPGNTSPQYDLEASVSAAILSENKNVYKSGDFAAESHVTLKTVENESVVTVYAMVLYLEFEDTEVGFKKGGGIHSPVAMTFERNKSGEYTLKEYWIPKDGALYAPSIKEKFPEDIYKDAIDTQKYIVAEMRACYAKAMGYVMVDTDAVIGKLFETICSSPAEASNPKAYIDAHPIEFRELSYYGDYTVIYVFSEFLKGGQTDLRGHIMLAAMKEVIAEELPELGLKGTAQEWFDAWKDYALRMREKKTSAYVEKNYPNTYMMLKLADNKKQ